MSRRWSICIPLLWARTVQISNPFFNNLSVTYQGFTEGNPNLKPEIALSYRGGGRLSARLPTGLQRVVRLLQYRHNAGDRLVLRGAAAQFVLRRRTAACADVTTVSTDPVGLPILGSCRVREFRDRKSEGLRYRASYMTSLDAIEEGWLGDISLGVNITHAISDIQDSGAPGVASRYRGNERNFLERRHSRDPSRVSHSDDRLSPTPLRLSEERGRA